MNIADDIELTLIVYPVGVEMISDSPELLPTAVEDITEYMISLHRYDKMEKKEKEGSKNINQNIHREYVDGLRSCLIR